MKKGKGIEKTKLKIGFFKPKHKYKITVIVLLLTGAFPLTYYFHKVLGTCIIFTHLYYIPIILASLWWRKKGLAVAFFLVGLLISSHLFLRVNAAIMGDFLRAAMFVVISTVVALLSQQISKAEEARRESEERYRTIFETARAPIVIVEDNMVISLANREFENLSGYLKGEIEGKKKWTGFVTEKFLERMKDFHRLRRVNPDVVPESYELQFIDRKGDIKEIFVSIGMIPGTKKSVASFLDITELKKKEKALRDGGEELSQIIQGNTVPAFVIDSNHTIKYWNKACEKLTGISAAKVVGTKKQWMAFYPEERPVMADLIVNEASKEEIAEHYKGEYRKSTLIEEAYEAEDFFSHLGEQGKWLFFTAAPLRGTDGKVVGAIETLQDITELKKTEEALRKAYEELKETQQGLIQSEKLAALGRFSSGFAHEIRNPLGNIAAAAQFCLTKYKSAEITKKHLSIILKNSEKANKIIKELLSFAKPREIFFEPERIGVVIDNVYDLVKTRCVMQKVRFTKSCPKTVPLIFLDRNRLEEAFLNFILNSLDAMPDGGELDVTVSHSSRNDEIIVTFSDTGEGISQESLSEIFEPFFTTKEDGIGLGLWLAHQVISYHKGKVQLKSKSGEGTKVIVRLPISRETTYVSFSG